MRTEIDFNGEQWIGRVEHKNGGKGLVMHSNVHVVLATLTEMRSSAGRPATDAFLMTRAAREQWKKDGKVFGSAPPDLMVPQDDADPPVG